MLDFDHVIFSELHSYSATTSTIVAMTSNFLNLKTLFDFPKTKKSYGVADVEFWA